MAFLGCKRFEKTLEELEVCQEWIDVLGNISDEERKNRKKLIELCITIALSHDHVCNKRITLK